MKKILSLMALACTLALTATAGAATTSGSLDLSDPTWGGCGSTVPLSCNYDVVEFTVDTTGLYTIDTFYPGDVPADENLDGYIRVFESAFDPANDGIDQIAFDDDGPGGQNTSQILDLTLTAGTSYFLVVTSFTDVPTIFGQPNGAWEADANGVGEVTFAAPIPVPAAVWLMMSGLIGLIAMRRRS